MSEDLQDRKIIVTGASSGIGRGIALDAARNGAKVTAVDVEEHPCHVETSTVDAIQENGGEAQFIKADVGCEEDVKRMVYDAAYWMGGVDGLVNNAGVYSAGKLHKVSYDEWKNVLRVNLDGVFFCMKYVLEHFSIEDVQGDIVNIGSIAGLVGFGSSPAYCASKGAVVELTREAALDYGSEGININAVDPGIIRTNMSGSLLADPDINEHLHEVTIAPRLGEPQDIASTVTFLLSEKSDFIMGENIVVDGGWTTQ